MANIRVDLDYKIYAGMNVTFRSPANCSQVDGLIVYYPDDNGIEISTIFLFADARGNNVGDVDLFAENALVKVILDTEHNKAYVQNADFPGRFTKEGGEIFGDYSNNKATDIYGHAEGSHTTASWRSHSEGYMTLATSTSHAEGRLSQATGKGSHAEGAEIIEEIKVNGRNVLTTEAAHIDGTIITVDADITTYLQIGDYITLAPTDTATGFTATDSKKVVEIGVWNEQQGTTLTLSSPFRAENYYPGLTDDKGNIVCPEDGIIPAGAKLRKAIGTKATNIASHAEGAGTNASGKYSHTEGYKTEANADCAHAEGNQSVASAAYTHAEGNNTSATGKASHVEGRYNVIDNSNTDSGGYRKYAHIVGNGTNNENRSNAHTLDWKGNAWYAGSIRIGGTSFDEGAEEIATKEYVSRNQVGVKNSNGGEAFNSNTTAIGTNSHAEGYGTTASGEASHAEGFGTTASKKYSHSEGSQTAASGDYSHAEGYITTASGNTSHSEGSQSSASGDYSHAEGLYTIADGKASHVQGRYSLPDDSEIDDKGYRKYAHIVGNGTGTASRSNCHTLDWYGNAWYSGSISADKGIVVNYGYSLDEAPKGDDVPDGTLFVLITE